MAKILVTGAAGFIGFHLSKRLLSDGNQVIAIDNINDYYDTNLKKARLEQIKDYDNFTFFEADLSNKNKVDDIIKQHQDIEYIAHLAAQAGVRYSTENPFVYVSSNLVGHMVMLEIARGLKNLKHFVYASSSSVYGGNKKIPFSETDNVDSPLSLYAATKKSDELLTHSYCHLYGIKATGLRFFTVYGPWGRPDMATYLFTDAIANDRPINVFNEGNMKRDFTYIDDIIEGTVSAIKTIPDKPTIYNLGNNKPEKLMDFINILEEHIGKKATIEYKPMHPGDVVSTYADIKSAQQNLNFSPKTSIDEGLKKFVDWYMEYKGNGRS